MIKYKCREDFLLLRHDDDGYPDGSLMLIRKGSEWIRTNKDFIGGEIHLESVGKDDQSWIELSWNYFEKLFEEMDE